MSSFTPHQFSRVVNKRGDASYRSSNSKNNGATARIKDAADRSASIANQRSVLGPPVPMAPPRPPPQLFEDAWDSDDERDNMSFYTVTRTTSSAGVSGRTDIETTNTFRRSTAHSSNNITNGGSQPELSYSFNSDFLTSDFLLDGDLRRTRPENLGVRDYLIAQILKFVSFARSTCFSLFLVLRQYVPCLQGHVKHDRDRRMGGNNESMFRFENESDCSMKSLKRYSAPLMIFVVFGFYIFVTVNTVAVESEEVIARIRVERFDNIPPDLPPVGGMTYTSSGFGAVQQVRESLEDPRSTSTTSVGEKQYEPLIQARGDSTESLKSGTSLRISVPAANIDATASTVVQPPRNSVPVRIEVQQIDRQPVSQTGQTVAQQITTASSNVPIVPSVKAESVGPSTQADSSPRGLSMLSDFPASNANTGIPFYWHVPKAGGTTMKQIISDCYQLVTASEVGVLPGLSPVNPPREKGLLKVVQNGSGVKYVNVETTSLAGLKWAKDNGLASSGLAEIISSHLFDDGAALFSHEHKGKVFTIMRNPIDRAASMFYYLGSDIAKHEQTYDPTLAEMTIEQYARSNKIENNWVTRSISGVMIGAINSEHLEQAKEVLRSKFLIGLLSQLGESMKRFEKYFGWSNKGPQLCLEKLVGGGMNKNTFTRQTVQPWSQDYILLLRHNEYDMQLYHYAEGLFAEQAKYFN